jgi:hypothetical protein
MERRAVPVGLGANEAFGARRDAPFTDLTCIAASRALRIVHRTSTLRSTRCREFSEGILRYRFPKLT